MNKHLYNMWKEFVLVHTNVHELFRKTSLASIYIQNYEVLFLFSSASSTWQWDIGGIERRWSEAPSWWMHSTHSHGHSAYGNSVHY
jgi:hypothetical protein